MYTGDPSFKNLGHFLEGYFTCLENHFGIRISPGFNYWMAEEIKPKFRNVIWWGQMLEKYKTDEKCLKKLPALLAKFLMSKEFRSFSDADWSQYKKKNVK